MSDPLDRGRRDDPAPEQAVPEPRAGHDPDGDAATDDLPRTPQAAPPPVLTAGSYLPPAPVGARPRRRRSRRRLLLAVAALALLLTGGLGGFALGHATAGSPAGVARVFGGHHDGSGDGEHGGPAPAPGPAVAPGPPAAPGPAT